jgi:glyoxylase-like metal-dependent hydrolase (beta-lactamase superfamily II)
MIVDECLDSEHAVALRRIVVGPLETNCWIIRAAESRQAILVDPGDEPDRILDAAADLAITAIVLTHAHFDHVLAVTEVAAAVRAPVFAHPADAPVWPHELRHLRQHGHFDAGTATAELLAKDQRSLTLDSGQAVWDGESRPVLDNQQLRLESVELTVLHTPGHTPGGLTIAMPGHLITGDTLFPEVLVLPVGRCLTSPRS